MKRYSTLVTTFLLALIIALPVSINAQKSVPKRVPKKTAKRRTPTPTPTPAIDMHPEAAKVATQVNNITRFLYTYGKVVNSLQVADEQAKREQVSATVTARNKASKDAVVANIRSLRIGLVNLSKEFQGNQKFQVQYLKLSFATEAITNAEQLASTGQYDEAGKALASSIDRLTDTLISMRLP